MFGTSLRPPTEIARLDREVAAARRIETAARARALTRAGSPERWQAELREAEQATAGAARVAQEAQEAWRRSAVDQQRAARAKALASIQAAASAIVRQAGELALLDRALSQAGLVVPGSDVTPAILAAAERIRLLVTGAPT